MPKLYLYIIFHLNLLYSSIEKIDRDKVINQCYWPILDLIENGIPIGLELSGKTLEIIQSIDPSWVRKFKTVISKGKCELIGSGYSQIIGPAIPSLVNDKNIKLGLQAYRKFLDVKPKTALVNEMTYSSGIVDHYINNSYSAIIMEWNNPYLFHKEWEQEWMYYPQKVVSNTKSEINLIWANSIAFQKFQRYIYGDYLLGEYMDYIDSHLEYDNRYFPLYCSDAEVFNYRPERYKAETSLVKDKEWKKISSLLNSIKRTGKFEFILPRQILDYPINKNSNNKLRLESSALPIPVKKQQKYSFSRWVVTGRDDLKINTKCYKIFNNMKKCSNVSISDWKKLCFLWSSDFRTHITEKRWGIFRRELDKFYLKWCDKKERKANKEKYQKITKTTKTSNIKVEINKKYIIIENSNIKIIINTYKGLTIDKCWFKKISKTPLFGNIPMDYYKDISYGADFFSGHAIIEEPGLHKITDLNKSKYEIYLHKKSSKIILKQIQNDKEILFSNKTIIANNYIKITKHIKLPQRRKCTIRPLNFTFLPEGWDQSSLYFCTHNGGFKKEKFRLGKNTIDQGALHSLLISSMGGLGATEGVLEVGDKNKKISFVHNQSSSALMPSVCFKTVDSSYFFRVHYSAQELDETFRENNFKQNISLGLKIF
jgi:hypothetical protein